MTNYKITTSKPKIVIHCEWKEMTNDIVITNEIYMGEFEEISNGFTLTLEVISGYEDRYVNNSLYTYSTDGGETWNTISSAKVVLEQVEKIRIKNGSDSYAFRLYSSDGNLILEGAYEGPATEDYFLTSDLTLIVSH